MPSRELTFGLKASQQHADIASSHRLWRAADEGGYDSLWLFDHFVPMGRTRAGDIFEAWTLLAAVAEVTRRVRIGTIVTGNIYRHPAVLAKMAVTVDHLSGGRLEMGLGAGGDELADRMLGIPAGPARERIERLDEACQVLRLLWTEPTASFGGRHYRLDGALADPKPVQHPGPPLWLGSSGERYGLRVVARHADVWINANLPPEVGAVSRLSRLLDRHCEQVGRDPGTIRRAAQVVLPAEPGETKRVAEEWVAAGFTDLIFLPLAGGLPLIEATAELLPQLRTLG